MIDGTDFVELTGEGEREATRTGAKIQGPAPWDIS
jgi:hypothetical protein